MPRVTQCKIIYLKQVHRLQNPDDDSSEVKRNQPSLQEIFHKNGIEALTSSI
jgi:hypothetical protein